MDKRLIGAIAMAGLLLLAGLGLGALVFSEPATARDTAPAGQVAVVVPKKVLDEGALEGDTGVKKVLTAKSPDGYDIPADKIESVDCPANKEVKAGNQFDCTAKIDGQDRTVHIKVRDNEGHYEVAVT